MASATIRKGEDSGDRLMDVCFIPHANIRFVYRRESTRAKKPVPLTVVQNQSLKPTWQFQRTRAAKKSSFTRNRTKSKKRKLVERAFHPRGTLVSKHAQERLRERGPRITPVYKQTEQGDTIVVTYLRRKWTQYRQRKPKWIRNIISNRRKRWRARAYERSGCQWFDDQFFVCKGKGGGQPAVVRKSAVMISNLKKRRKKKLGKGGTKGEGEAEGKKKGGKCESGGSRSAKKKNKKEGIKSDDGVSMGAEELIFCPQFNEMSCFSCRTKKFLEQNRFAMCISCVSKPKPLPAKLEEPKTTTKEPGSTKAHMGRGEGRRSQKQNETRQFANAKNAAIRKGLGRPNAKNGNQTESSTGTPCQRETKVAYTIVGSRAKPKKRPQQTATNPREGTKDTRRAEGSTGGMAQEGYKGSSANVQKRNPGAAAAKEKKKEWSVQKPFLCPSCKEMQPFSSTQHKQLKKRSPAARCKKCVATRKSNRKGGSQSSHPARSID